MKATYSSTRGRTAPGPFSFERDLKPASPFCQPGFEPAYEDQFKIFRPTINAVVKTKIKIRRCRAGDFEGVIALLRQLWPEKRLHLAALRSAFERALVADRQLHLCAVCDRQLVGFGSLSIKSDLWGGKLAGHVDELVVDAVLRGQGIGTRMLDHLVSSARRQGCDRIGLDATLYRNKAQGFYEHRGFQRRAYVYAKTL